MARVKSQVEGEVQAEIAEHAAVTRRRKRAHQSSRRRVTRQSVDEVVETEREVGRARGVARISQVIDYLFFLLYALLVCGSSWP